MPRYFASPAGGLAEVGDGPLAMASVPDSWEEVTAEEYQTRQEQARQAVEQAAEEFIAADGDVPSDPDVTVPIEHLTPPATGHDHDHDLDGQG
ncbi:hypothetical protein GTY54_52145 [Streptomyces sp. SID625]|nr:hypothetical protein [Streptomyces sp. SID625]MYR64418.1 hypothetical protein [Streptomyces sp. SID625]